MLKMLICQGIYIVHNNGRHIAICFNCKQKMNVLCESNQAGITTYQTPSLEDMHWSDYNAIQKLHKSNCLEYEPCYYINNNDNDNDDEEVFNGEEVFNIASIRGRELTFEKCLPIPASFIDLTPDGYITFVENNSTRLSEQGYYYSMLTKTIKHYQCEFSYDASTVHQITLSNDLRRFIISMKANHDNRNVDNCKTSILPQGATANVAQYNVRPQYPDYATKQSRTNSFNLLRLRSQFPHMPSTQKLVEAGQFYSGNGSNDHTRCFVCGEGHKWWTQGDDAWVEHARWHPQCTNPLRERGQAFVSKVYDLNRQTLTAGVQQSPVPSLDNLNLYSHGAEASTSAFSRSRFIEPALSEPPMHNADMANIYNRLRTLEPPVCTDIEITLLKNEVANAGLYFAYDRDSEQFVFRCYHCDIGLGVEDYKYKNLIQEHAKGSAYCAYIINLIGQDLVDMYVSNMPQKCPHFQSQKARQSSYIGWPIESIIHASKLVKAGFYWTGEDDCVRCFHCDVGAHSWEVGDDPFEEHVELNSNCPYINETYTRPVVLGVMKKIRERKQREEKERERNERERLRQAAGNGNVAMSNLSSSQNTQSNTLTVIDPDPGPGPDLYYDMNSAEVGAVRFMGYPNEIIKKSLDILRINKMRVDSTAILQEIFKIEEGNQGFQEGASCVPSEYCENDLPQQEQVTHKNLSLDQEAQGECMRILRENEQLKEDGKCKACNDNDAIFIVLPCGHRSLCAKCLPITCTSDTTVQSAIIYCESCKNKNTCPACRKPCTGHVRFYLV